METSLSAEARGLRRASRPCDPFSQLVRKIVLREHRGVLRELADLVGLSYGALYNRLNGRAEFNPREINILLRELDDRRLVDCLLEGTRFHATVHAEGAAPVPAEEALRLVLSYAAETLSVVRATIDMSRTGGMDRRLSVEIEYTFLRMQQELVQLRESLSEGGPGLEGGKPPDVAGALTRGKRARVAATAGLVSTNAA